MPRRGIKYSISGITAQFVFSTKQWLVESNNKEYYFKNVLEVVEQFPDLLKVDRISYMTKYKERVETGLVKEHNSKTIQKPKKEELQKVETCYYCSGSGITVSGFKCTNCKGTGEIVVTATLY